MQGCPGKPGRKINNLLKISLKLGQGVRECYIVSVEDARITGLFKFTPTFIFIFENALASIKTILNANSLSYKPEL